MAINYHIYSGDSSGGPVDYFTPIATVSGLTWDTPPLGPDTVTTFAVRAFDTVSGLEESNVDARVTIKVGPANEDRTSIPNPPTGLSGYSRPAAAILVAWQYNPGGQGGPPTGFHVYAGTSSISYTLPLATVPYIRTARSFSTTLTGLSDGQLYEIGVRAYNATGEESNATVIIVEADATGPLPVGSLSATVIP